MSDLFTPTRQGTVPIRPLTGGIVLNKAPQLLSAGEFLDLRNFDVGPEGLRRTGGWRKHLSSQLAYPAWDMVEFRGADGTAWTAVVDGRYLYKYTLAGGLVPVYYLNTTHAGLVSSSGVTVTNNTDEDWASDEIVSGDVLVVGGTEYVIASVTSDTVLVLREAPASDFTSQAYVIRKAFDVESGARPVLASVYDKLYIADGRRSLLSFDGSTLESVDDTYPSLHPKAVAYFKDRVWIANIEESDGTWTFRIRWTEAGFGNFDEFPAANYIDLPYTKGEIITIFPMANYLVVYFEDDVWLGRVSNIVGLPLSFSSAETGGIGIVGPRAVSSYLGGNFFVGQDNIYYISNEGVKPIGDKVVRKALEGCKYPERIMVTVDPRRSRVLFGIPNPGEEINTIWSFNTKTAAWGKSDWTCNVIRGSALSASQTIDDLTEDIDDLDLTYPNINSLGAITRGVDSLFSFLDRQLYVYDPDQENNEISSTLTLPIEVEVETGDFDVDSPETQKVFSRLSVKLLEPTDEEVLFRVWGSANRGRTWKELGPLRITAGHDEGKVDFRLMGQLGRFYLWSTASISPYTITELVLRVRVLGTQVQGRGSE